MAKKIAAVTGSRRGIGLGIAKALCNEGYTVVITGTGAQADSSDVLSHLRSAGHDVHYIRLNISSPMERDAFFKEIEEKFGRLDVLVNNAGMAPRVRMDILETTCESFEEVISVNLEGTFFMCQSAANLMLSMQTRALADYTPRIINISSMSSYTSSVNRGEYCISKAGISMVTQLFADRLAEFSIPVFEVRPGIIETDMTAKVRDKYEKMIAEGLTPIARMGSPEDVAACVLCAVSGRLDFATGQILNADGGFHIRRM